MLSKLVFTFSSEWHVSTACLILLKAALFTNIITIIIIIIVYYSGIETLV